MSYQSLDRKSKMSFQKTLQYYLEEFLESNHYEAAKVDFVTDLFIGKLGNDRVSTGKRRIKDLNATKSG